MFFLLSVPSSSLLRCKCIILAEIIYRSDEIQCKTISHHFQVLSRQVNYNKHSAVPEPIKTGTSTNRYGNQEVQGKSLESAP